MQRRGALKSSEVDKTFQSLVIGQKVPVKGSITYWRNRQAVFHKENPTAWVRISVVKKRGFAERIA